MRYESRPVRSASLRVVRSVGGDDGSCCLGPDLDSTMLDYILFQLFITAVWCCTFILMTLCYVLVEGAIYAYAAAWSCSSVRALCSVSRYPKQVALALRNAVHACGFENVFGSSRPWAWLCRRNLARLTGRGGNLLRARSYPRTIWNLSPEQARAHAGVLRKRLVAKRELRNLMRNKKLRKLVPVNHTPEGDLSKLFVTYHVCMRHPLCMGSAQHKGGCWTLTPDGIVFLDQQIYLPEINHEIPSPKFHDAAQHRGSAANPDPDVH